MQNANKAWWRDVKIYRSKDVSWGGGECRRMVEHVHSVFCFVSENWSGRQAILDRIERWDTETVWRLFRFKKSGRDLHRVLSKDGKGGQNDLDR